jgi:hypothetical protein
MGKSRRPNGVPENPVRSVRVDNPTWDKAVRRARSEGTTMSAVLLLFTKGYASGLINAPRTQLVFTGQGVGPAPAEPATAAE